MKNKIIAWSFAVLLIAGIVFAQISVSNNIFDKKEDALTEYEKQQGEISLAISEYVFDVKIVSDKICDMKGDCTICFSYPDIINVNKEKPEKTPMLKECFHFSEESSKEQNFEEIRQYIIKHNTALLEQTKIVYVKEVIDKEKFDISILQYSKPLPCISDKWLPSVDDYCELEVFEQVNECGEKRKAIGTKVCKEKEAITFGKTKNDFGAVVNPALETEDTEVISNEPYPEGRGEHDINSD